MIQVRSPHVKSAHTMTFDSKCWEIISSSIATHFSWDPQGLGMAQAQLVNHPSDFWFQETVSCWATEFWTPNWTTLLFFLKLTSKNLNIKQRKQRQHISKLCFGKICHHPFHATARRPSDVRDPKQSSTLHASVHCGLVVAFFYRLPIGSMYGIYTNIGDILMGSMLPYIPYMDPMG